MTEQQPQTKPKPIVLAILDGWGLSPAWHGNAISFANPPAMAELWRSYPHTVLHAYQPETQSQRHQIGSSDIGHAMIGSGRLIKSDLEEITTAIDQGVFASNPTLIDAMRAAVQKRRPLHLVGLASDGGIHANLATLRALLELAKSQRVRDVFLHLIADGRDVPPTSVELALKTIEEMMSSLEIGQIATLIGRYYAMDRDEHWDRTLLAYRLWTQGIGRTFKDPREAVRTLYSESVTDEYFPPIRLTAPGQTTISHDDVVIVWNARADRLRQLVQAFTDPLALRAFFRRHAPVRRLAKFVSLVSPRLALTLPMDIAFPPARLPTTLPQVLAGRGLKQLRAAESEKAAHITNFFGGGREEPFPGEERLIVRSPAVRSAREQPGMATEELLRRFLDKLACGTFHFAVINVANVDLVGHSGDLFATAEAIRIADRAIGRLAERVLAQDGTLLVTADHGNAEQMIQIHAAEPDQAHTINPVPFIYVSNTARYDLVRQAITSPQGTLGEIMRSRATLADIAPTILELFNIPVPVEMTGQSLLAKLRDHQVE